jgi:hypothetical protein
MYLYKGTTVKITEIKGNKNVYKNVLYIREYKKSYSISCYNQAQLKESFPDGFCVGYNIPKEHIKKIEIIHHEKGKK